MSGAAVIGAASSGAAVGAAAVGGATAPVVLRWLGRTGYEPTLQAMRQQVQARRPGDGADQIWLTEHDPVYTLGQAGREEHVLDAGAIPVLRTERGGQVTYHGPGQVVAYPIVELRRFGLGPRAMVCVLERAVIATLSELGLSAGARDGAPGVYRSSDGAKIASLGLKIRQGVSYHGVALNVAMDLGPFSGIDPCGYRGQTVSDLRSSLPAHVALPALHDVASRLGEHIAALLTGAEPAICGRGA